MGDYQIRGGSSAPDKALSMRREVADQVFFCERLTASMRVETCVRRRMIAASATLVTDGCGLEMPANGNNEHIATACRKCSVGDDYVSAVGLSLPPTKRIDRREKKKLPVVKVEEMPPDNPARA